MHWNAPETFAKMLAAVPVSDDWKNRLHGMMSGHDRRYHGVDHLALLFDRHLRFGCEAGFDGVAQTRFVACAIAFHDCVYEPGRHDNEERSADAWLEASATCGLDALERGWVADTIRATSDHLSYSERAGPNATPGSLEALRLWMLDLDLTPFGEPPAVFDRNTELLREEASHLDDEDFEASLICLLQRFADASTIYRTAVIADHFDAPARRNIARRLSKRSPGSPNAAI